MQECFLTTRCIFIQRRGKRKCPLHLKSTELTGKRKKQAADRRCAKARLKCRARGGLSFVDKFIDIYIGFGDDKNKLKTQNVRKKNENYKCDKAKLCRYCKN